MDEGLSGQLARVSGELAALRRELADQYESKQVTGRRRRRAVALVLVAVLLTLGIENGGIARCFLTPPAGVTRHACGVLFPGYAAVRARQDAAITQYQRLLEAVPANAADVQDLRHRVADLERAAKEEGR